MGIIFLYYISIPIINIGIPAYLIYSAVQKKRGRANVFSRSSLPETPEWFGVRLGLKLSLTLSITYALVGVFIVETFTDQKSSAGFLFLWTFGSPIIFLLAVLPAVVYGILTGLFLAILINKFRSAFSSNAFFLLGIAICAVLIVLTHYIFNIQVVFSLVDTSPSDMNLGVYTSYPFLIGIPAIIYILSGGWAGWYIYKRFNIEYKSS